ncbi:NAD(P)H dehydrogenase [Reichenbachiella sp. 5M10]|uniref:NAD(P)H-dependent oxidoreductase n=1 Tax=Reichenbachiella sp. 5M10 TaxID=1889772 RepID=UPI000C15A073|nr:NAD(P)H-dependent oxidoreductase [Reichenbachiella sp. 5M10]PIB35334.1 NAD(P)H dehydrogenase [Reichenbachiella sp. 5M10]
MKRILIVNGHPDKESFNYALAEAYQKGAAHATLDQLNLIDLVFDPNLNYGYRKRTDLEPDLKKAWQKIKDADHLVWVFPMWWYSYPALMKGFIDRTFLPGHAFEFEEGKVLPKKILKGKSARIIVTADTPRWYDYLWMRSPALNQFKKGTLQFCGIDPVRVTYIAPIKHSSAAFRDKWLQRIERLGQRLG